MSFKNPHGQLKIQGQLFEDEFESRRKSCQIQNCDTQSKNNGQQKEREAICFDGNRIANKLVRIIKSSSRITTLTYPVRLKEGHRYESRKKFSEHLTQIESKWLTERLNRVPFERPANQDVDSGYAWIILATVFVINASTFGTARAYGLIFEKLARDGDQSRSNAALPFTIMGAVENMGGPFASYMLTKTGSWRTTVFIGCCLVTGAHFLAAFIDSMWAQVLVMGVMCGSGLSMVTISFFQINNSYFVRYRSRAFGLGLTGAVFGTMYISPVCQLVLEEYNTSGCYLVLSLILLPNVPLTLLLKPRHSPAPQLENLAEVSNEQRRQQQEINEKETINESFPASVSSLVTKELRQQQETQRDLWTSIKLVIGNPIFHLIWPTQLLFCWFNFVYGMIIVDFGKDRGLDDAHVAQLIPIWALGQLVGRVALGALVDIKLISYEMFTVVCFSSIGVTTYLLNNLRDETYDELTFRTLVFILSMFIANLYILFNGLTAIHMEQSLSSLSIGISSFTGSFFLLPRAAIIGYYRDTTGNYDPMLSLFTYTSFLAALLWLSVPLLESSWRPAKLIRSFLVTKNEIECVKHLPTNLTTGVRQSARELEAIR